jgi:hypothetical protein
VDRVPNLSENLVTPGIEPGTLKYAETITVEKQNNIFLQNNKYA